MPGRRLTIGARGDLVLGAGRYVYVGSAHGAGGLAGRLAHHLAAIGRPHWHIDYLRANCRLRGVWVTNGARTLEHAWAQRVGALDVAFVPLPGFGASDCRCVTHLLQLPAALSLGRIGAVLGCGTAPRYLPRRRLQNLLA